MNQDQFLSWLRSTLAIVGGLAVQYGITNASTVATVTGFVMALAPFVWGFFVHTDAAKVLAAKDTPGVAKIEIRASEAAPAVRDIARDTSSATRNVTFAPPGA